MNCLHANSDDYPVSAVAPATKELTSADNTTLAVPRYRAREFTAKVLEKYVAPPKHINSSRSRNVRQSRSPADRPAVARMLPARFACRRPTPCASAWLTLVAVFLFCSTVQADEGGTSFWLPGFFSSLAAVPPAPGLYLVDANYYYNGSASRQLQFEKGPVLAGGLSAEGAAPIFTLLWAPAGEKWFGGQPSFSLTWAPAWERVAADLTVSTMNGSRSFNVSGSQVGGSDLYPEGQINWNDGNHNWMSYLTGNIPIGAYQADRLANIGLGHAAVDAGGGYTYLNLQNGRELSAVLGFTFNAENTHTNYQSGVDMHLDWAVSQFLSNHVAVGVVGYWYQQLTPDSGTGDRVGSFKSEVAAVGGEANYLFNMLGQQAIVSMRGYWEFSAQHRPQGTALYAQIIIPLTPAKNTPH